MANWKSKHCRRIPSCLDQAVVNTQRNEGTLTRGISIDVIPAKISSISTSGNSLLL